MRSPKDWNHQTTVHTAATCAIFATGIAAYLVFVQQPLATKAVQQRPSHVGRLIIRQDQQCRTYDFDNVTGAISLRPGHDCPRSTDALAPTNRIEAIRRGWLGGE